jgi:alkylation response protein AidB-like acyl-CoA dehydrogenase
VEAGLRSERLLRVRTELARAGHLGVAVTACDGGCGRPSTVQTLMQFICGYHDVDLRDSTGLGHGRLIATRASAPVRDRWLPRLPAGEPAGIAITERSGGSRPHAITTVVTPRRGWRLVDQRHQDLDQPIERGAPDRPIQPSSSSSKLVGRFGGGQSSEV